jgi:hypothetical protein
MAELPGDDCHRHPPHRERGGVGVAQDVKRHRRRDTAAASRRGSELKIAEAVSTAAAIARTVTRVHVRAMEDATFLLVIRSSDIIVVLRTRPAILRLGWIRKSVWG